MMTFTCHFLPIDCIYTLYRNGRFYMVFTHAKATGHEEQIITSRSHIFSDILNRLSEITDTFSLVNMALEKLSRTTLLCLPTRKQPEACSFVFYYTTLASRLQRKLLAPRIRQINEMLSDYGHHAQFNRLTGRHSRHVCVLVCYSVVYSPKA